jgi:hypothetical protein
MWQAKNSLAKYKQKGLETLGSRALKNLKLLSYVQW